MPAFAPERIVSPDPEAGPVLLFGGAYSNRQATEALRQVAAAEGIPAERTLCTGDAVAYCGAPAATVAALRAWNPHVVMGNCDEALGADSDDCGCGFASGSACDWLAQQWYAYARAQVDADAKAWLAGLPRRIDLDLGGRRLAAIHGGSDAINRFLFASASDAVLAAELDALEAAGGAPLAGAIAGHCGVPFTRHLADGRIWHNPGAIGMPANEATPRGWYSRLEADGSGGLALRHEALAFDVEAAAAELAAAGLPAGYRANLLTGLWPSLDVLPEAERAATGARLAPDGVTLPVRPARPV